MTDFIDWASTLLVRSSNSAHLKRVTSGLQQQWDLPVPGSVQSQEVPSLGLLPQIIMSCNRAKLEPTLLAIISAALLWKGEGKRCPLKSIHSLFHGTRSMAWGQSLVQLPRGLLPFLGAVFSVYWAWSLFEPATPWLSSEMRLMTELRAGVPVGGCCLLSAPLAPATL